jgi:esterase/lipase
MFGMILKHLKRLLFYPAIYLIICLFLYLNQGSLIYFPTENVQHNFDREYLKIENDEIEISQINKGKEKAILYFGGNAEILAYTAFDFESNFPNHTIYMMNYPGYGNSTGVPSEISIFQAAEKLFARSKQKHSSISIIGRSLGTGVASFLAANKDIEKLILITPFDSLMQVAQDKFFMLPIKYLLTDEYNSLSRANQIRAKTLVYLAQNDEVIPYENSNNLLQALDAKITQSKVVKSVGHNDISDSLGFYLELNHFIEN